MVGKNIKRSGKMALSKKPVTGMKDILPEEMKIRNYVQNVIKDTYKAFGFTQIETPCVENISNLTSKQGGENEKLIFKILKRFFLFNFLLLFTILYSVCCCNFPRRGSFSKRIILIKNTNKITNVNNTINPRILIQDKRRYS